MTTHAPELSAQNPEKNRKRIEVETGPTLGVVVPSVGRPSLAATLDSLVDQLRVGDRVSVVCDDPSRFNFCLTTVDSYRHYDLSGAVWRCIPSRPLAEKASLGCFGHPARNVALLLFAILDEAPDWCWTVDDDDVATFGALDMIRSACESGRAPWYVFRMRGGPQSHFPGVTVPTMGDVVGKGNVGTPMIVFPVEATSRFGVAEIDGHDAGYFGDYEMAVALQQELGRPEWVPTVVCEVRP